MSGWRLQTSRLGDLESFTFEARTPVPLGTMFKNGAECISGAVVFQDIAMRPEKQKQKKYYFHDATCGTVA